MDRWPLSRQKLFRKPFWLKRPLPLVFFCLHTIAMALQLLCQRCGTLSSLDCRVCNTASLEDPITILLARGTVAIETYSSSIRAAHSEIADGADPGTNLAAIREASRTVALYRRIQLILEALREEGPIEQVWHSILDVCHEAEAADERATSDISAISMSSAVSATQPYPVNLGGTN